MFVIKTNFLLIINLILILIFRLVKNFPCKIISKMLQELLQGKEQLNKFENDILKIQQKIDSLENEYKKLESDDPSNKNQDLIKVIKTEKDNLRNLLNEYLHKIGKELNKIFYF